MEQKVPQVLVSCRKLNGVWEAVLIVKGEFERTYRGEDLGDVVTSAIGNFLTFPYSEDTRVQVVMNIVSPETSV